MTFVDASALAAILCDEPEAAALLDRLDAGGPFFTSPLAVYEAVLAVARSTHSTVAEASADVTALLTQVDIAIEPVTASHGTAAVAAFARFGKGRHPARLNMGDCFAYAAAKARGASILFVGDDFSRTDLPNALAPA